MADETARELAEREAKAFERKDNLHSLWQEIALNFYAARADFTAERCLGEEYAIDQFDSEPERCRRDLADARSSMLRPDGQEWVRARTRDEKLNERPDIARVLDFINSRLRYYLDEPEHGFGRAEKEADNDLVSFGNAVKTAEAEINRYGERKLVVRSWHPRDCAWSDDTAGTRQDLMFRKFRASARHIRKMYPDAELHGDVERALEKEPDKEFGLCHVMMPADEYGWYKRPLDGRDDPWASVYYDSDHKMLLRERSSPRFRYVVDRWMTISGSQYGYSPATMVALPDARMMQVMARVLQEASEKSLDPPLKATKGAVVSDIDLGAAGVTWVDRDYDEKQGPAISTLLPEMRQIPIGIDLIARTTLALRDNFYLSKLRLPMQAKTAFETQALLEQFIRENLPLFGPWQAGITMMIDEIFGVLFAPEMRELAFGYMAEWPEELLDRELVYTFQNPLKDAIERNRVNQAQQAFGMIAGAAQIDPGAAHVADVPQILRDAIRGTGAPADWLSDEEQAAQAASATAQTSNILGALGMAEQAAGVVKTGTEAAANLQQINGQAADSSFAYGPA